MFIASLFLLFASPKAPLSATDSAFLTRIDKAVSRMSDKKTAFVRFEKAVTKVDAIRCNQLQSKVAPNSGYYADCAFVQAWYGIDYDANLYRLLRPYRFSAMSQSVARQERQKSEAEQQKEYSSREAMSALLLDLDSFYDALNWLYLKHHDLKSLGAWEDLTLDGAPSEGSSDELGVLWVNHAPDMLRAAYGHPLRIKNLAEALAFSNTNESFKEGKKRTIEEVTPYTRYKEKRVASAAKSLVSKLRSEKY